MMDPHSAYSKQEKTFIDYLVIYVYVCLATLPKKKKKHNERSGSWYSGKKGKTKDLIPTSLLSYHVTLAMALGLPRSPAPLL